MSDYTSKEELYAALDKTLAVLKQDEAFKQRIARAEMSMGFIVTDLGAEYTLSLNKGDVSGSSGGASQATFSVTLNSATLDRLLSGRLDGESAYMSGALRLRGSEWVAQSAESYLPGISKVYRSVRGEA